MESGIVTDVIKKIKRKKLIDLFSQSEPVSYTHLDVYKRQDTMGLKHLIRYGLYVIKGSVSAQLAEKTGFSQEDAEKLKEALRTLFENDASAARPDGSMEICQMYWWQHESATPSVSVATVHKSVRVTPLTDIPLRFEDYEVVYTPVGDVKAEIY